MGTFGLLLSGYKKPEVLGGAGLRYHLCEAPGGLLKEALSLGGLQELKSLGEWGIHFA